MYIYIYMYTCIYVYIHVCIYAQSIYTCVYAILELIWRTLYMDESCLTKLSTSTYLVYSALPCIISWNESTCKEAKTHRMPYLFRSFSAKKPYL